MIPAGAPRSDDGYYWWDGATWQPVPQGEMAVRESAGPPSAEPAQTGGLAMTRPPIASGSGRYAIPTTSAVAMQTWSKHFDEPWAAVASAAPVQATPSPLPPRDHGFSESRPRHHRSHAPEYVIAALVVLIAGIVAFRPTVDRIDDSRAKHQLEHVAAAETILRRQNGSYSFEITDLQGAGFTGGGIHVVNAIFVGNAQTGWCETVKVYDDRVWTYDSTRGGLQPRGAVC